MDVMYLDGVLGAISGICYLTYDAIGARAEQCVHSQMLIEEKKLSYIDITMQWWK